jgi:hypothetical protein
MQWLSVMALNLGFREFIGIMERDGRLDIYFWSLTRTHIGLIRTCTSWNIHPGWPKKYCCAADCAPIKCRATKACGYER